MKIKEIHIGPITVPDCPDPAEIQRTIRDDDGFYGFETVFVEDATWYALCATRNDGSRLQLNRRSASRHAEWACSTKTAPVKKPTLDKIMKPTCGLWSDNNARLQPKAWLIGSKWCAVLGKQIVSKRRFDTKAEALREAARQQQREGQQNRT
jgi:hypothetical protein